MVQLKASQTLTHKYFSTLFRANKKLEENALKKIKIKHVPRFYRGLFSLNLQA